MRYYSPDLVVHVVVTDEGDDGHIDGGRIVGYSVWERKGSSQAAKSWRKKSLWNCKYCYDNNGVN